MASRAVPWVLGRQRAGLRRWGAVLLGYLAMGGAVALVGVPLLWMLSAAFKETKEIYVFPSTWIPQEPTLANFPRAWQSAPFGRYYLNSTIVTVLGSLGKLLNAVLSAYALAYLRFPAKDLVFLVILAALMVPPQVTIVPWYLLMSDLGWINTYQGLIVPELGVAFATFLLRQAFLSLPREVIEAAKVDGAGHLRILWSVVLPLSQPVLVTVTLLLVVTRWNEFLWPLIITNTADMRTLPIGIFWLLDQEGNTQWGVVMAGTIFVILPLLVIFLLAQRFIVSGITAGAVKT
jgi:sn-glycerol 3-phosphate transport system permease protein